MQFFQAGRPVDAVQFLRNRAIASLVEHFVGRSVEDCEDLTIKI
jgi:hypothetical protein